MGKTFYDSSLLETYINEKKSAYAYYDEFSRLSRNDKIRCIEEIKERKYDSYLINEAVADTLLYPNDLYLMDGLKDRDSLHQNINIENAMILSKRQEYLVFDFRKLVSGGIFTLDEIGHGPIEGDAIYQEFYDILPESQKKF